MAHVRWGRAGRNHYFMRVHVSANVSGSAVRPWRQRWACMWVLFEVICCASAPPASSTNQDPHIQFIIPQKEPRHKIDFAILFTNRNTPKNMLLIVLYKTINQVYVKLSRETSSALSSFFKKTLDTSKPSGHPPNQGWGGGVEVSKRLDGNTIGCKDISSSWDFIGFSNKW